MENSQRIHSAKTLPAELQDDMNMSWITYEQNAIENNVKPVQHPELRAVLTRVWAYSEFVAQLCITHPEVLNSVICSGDLYIDYPQNGYQQRLQHALVGIENEASLIHALRLFRRREMLRIAIRDLAGWVGLQETMTSLSQLAKACVADTLGLLHRWGCKEYGWPHGAVSGKPQQLMVLGMGKLGADELNFSSDIDLIFAFPEQGETKGKQTSISNEEFFTRLGRRLINALDATTAQGFVFRVDMRLRPFGDSGPLVISFAAMEDYYQNHGRDWERYALVKAQPITGDPQASQTLMTVLIPFVYRRYLDFGAFAALREMKALIVQQVNRKGMMDNIKLGSGGIREVEFIGQVFQLIRGGREHTLRQRSILPILATLGEKSYLPDHVVRELTKAYVFLRHTENRLQAYADKQTHTLPKNEPARLRLALAMGFSNWHQFSNALEKNRALVHQHFEQIFAAPQSEHDSTEDGINYTAIWSGELDNAEVARILSASNYDDTKEFIILQTQLRNNAAIRALSQRGRERLGRLIPLLYGAVDRSSEPMTALKRVFHVIETIGRRPAYFDLLVEHPMVLSQLVKLCAASPWISEFVAQHPLLLDDLLDPRSLYEPLKRDVLVKNLSETLTHIAADDLEQQMDVLRHFAQSNRLHVAAADVVDAMPLMVVSDHLTDIAEVTINTVLSLAWQQLTARYGLPTCCVSSAIGQPGFAIIAYGKLGGIELGYGSDLDLVFLHDNRDQEGLTSGPKSINNAVFFVRFGQRIIHMLNTRTHSGVLYEVDMRLRPSGTSGLLVSSMTHFIDYQRTQAWTWEHQALVRARVVGGDPSIAARFADIRNDVLSRERDPELLGREVRDMRERMRTELGSRNKHEFNIKQDTGGIADIEFIVQYAVLRWAHSYPQLLTWTDNIRLLETLEQIGVLSVQDAQQLCDAYRKYRAEIHRLTLQDRDAVVTEDCFQSTREAVRRIWRTILGDVEYNCSGPL